MSFSKNGFTLIELLVATTISVLVAGFSIAGYRHFEDRKMVDLAVDELRSQLTMIKSMAIVAEKPSGCDALEKYNIRYNNSGIEYRTYCNGVFSLWTRLSNEFFSIEGISITVNDNDNNFSFAALSGELKDAPVAGVNFEIRKAGVCKRVTISGNGNISLSGC